MGIEDIVCVWHPENDGDHSYYSTSCGEDYMFPDGGPTENLYNFCPNCGRKIKQERAEDAINTKI